jgi:diacylglycerol kinase
MAGGLRQKGSLAQAFGYAIAGIAETVKTQRNMRIHLVVALLALFAGAVLRLTSVEWALIVVCICLVLAAELFNTALEAIVDLLSPTWQARAKLAKDASAGAVLVVALMAIVVGLLVFGSAGLRLLP